MDLKKLHSATWNKRRDVTDLRKRASIKIKEARQSNRSTVLNRYRHVEILEPKVKKATAKEQKTTFLQTYRTEKKKKMEELKKIGPQKPPFYNLIKVRHTGGTPFRDPQPFKPLLPATRSRTQLRNNFQFKATLTSNTAVTAGVNSKLPLTTKNTLKKHGSASDVIGGSKAVSDKQRLTKIKKTNTMKDQDTNKENKTFKFKAVPEFDSKQTKNKAGGVLKKKNDSNTEAGSNSRQITLRSHSANTTKVPEQQKSKPVKPKAPKKKKNLNENNEPDIPSDTVGKTAIQDILAKRLADNVFIMSPITNHSTRRQTRKRPEASIELESFITAPDDEKNNEEIVETLKSQGTALHRTKLNSETDRLNALIETWSEINCDGTIPEEFSDEILAVVGQTKLLLSKKFKHFNSLIDTCELDQDTLKWKVTTDDLEGYWEMTYQEVDQLTSKYTNLENLRNNNWLSIPKAGGGSKRKSRKASKSKSKTGKSAASRFKDFLKEKQVINFVVQEKNSECENAVCNLDMTSDQLPSDATFVNTPVKQTLLRVMGTEDRKRRSSAGMITLRNSFLAKAVLTPVK